MSEGTKWPTTITEENREYLEHVYKGKSTSFIKFLEAGGAQAKISIAQS